MEKAEKIYSDILQVLNSFLIKNQYSIYLVKHPKKKGIIVFCLNIDLSNLVFNFIYPISTNKFYLEMLPKPIIQFHNKAKKDSVSYGFILSTDFLS